MWFVEILCIIIQHYFLHKNQTRFHKYLIINKLKYENIVGTVIELTEVDVRIPCLDPGTKHSVNSYLLCHEKHSNFSYRVVIHYVGNKCLVNGQNRIIPRASISNNSSTDVENFLFPGNISTYKSMGAGFQKAESTANGDLCPGS